MQIEFMNHPNMLLGDFSEIPSTKYQIPITHLIKMGSKNAGIFGLYSDNEVDTFRFQFDCLFL